MPATDSITQARLKELLEYDPDTGLFVWLISKGTAKKGSVAGSYDAHGYIQIGIDGALYKAHRLVFLCMVGWMPEQVDHDNRIRDDNRWKNLNPATRTINGKNQKLHSDNTSGHCGAYWHKRSGKWMAQTGMDGKSIYLGLFTHKADAIAARQAADIQYGFHENHGGT